MDSSAITSYIAADPLIKKLWVAIKSNEYRTSTDRVVEETLNAFLSKNPDIFELHININLNDVQGSTLEELRRIILCTRKFRVGEEKSFPEICIYFPYLLGTHDLIELISTLDIYYPGINVFLVVREEDVFDLQILDKARTISHILYEEAINFRFLFFLESDINVLETMIGTAKTFLLEQRNSTVDVPTFPPIFEIDPRIKVHDFRDFARTLLSFCTQYPEILESITLGFCGFLCLLFRAKEAYIHKKQIESVPVVPLFSCGVGSLFEQELAEQGNVVSSCFYSVGHECHIPDQAMDECMACEYVEYCTGCSISRRADNTCNLYSFVHALLTEFKQQPQIVEQLRMPEPQIGILELDWDYIYDSFEDVSFKKIEFH